MEGNIFYSSLMFEARNDDKQTEYWITIQNLLDTLSIKGKSSSRLIYMKT